MNQPVASSSIGSILADLPTVPNGVVASGRSGILPPSSSAAGGASKLESATHARGLSFTVLAGRAARATTSVKTQTVKVGRSAMRSVRAAATRTPGRIRAATAELRIATRGFLIQAEATLTPRMQGVFAKLRLAAQTLDRGADGKSRQIIERSIARHCATLDAVGLKRLLTLTAQYAHGTGVPKTAGKLPVRMDAMLSPDDLGKIARPLIEKALTTRQFGASFKALTNMVKTFHDKPPTGVLDSQLKQLCEKTLAGCGASVMHGRDALVAGFSSMLEGKTHQLGALRSLFNGQLFQSTMGSTETGLLLSALASAVDKAIEQQLPALQLKWLAKSMPPSDIHPDLEDDTEPMMKGQLQDATGMAVRDLHALGLFTPGVDGAAVDPMAVLLKHMAPIINDSSRGLASWEREDIVETHANRLNRNAAQQGGKDWDVKSWPTSLFDNWESRETKARDIQAFMNRYQ